MCWKAPPLAKAANRIQREYPDVELEHMLVDNCAMQLVRNPISLMCWSPRTCSAIFSPINFHALGSIGMLASASIGSQVSLYEPAHGSAPVCGPANSQSFSRHSFGCSHAGIFLPVAGGGGKDQGGGVLSSGEGYRTPDLKEPGCRLVSTASMGDLVCSKLSEQVDRS